MAEEILLIAGVVIAVLMLFRMYVRGARCKSKVKLHDKTVIVTGKRATLYLFYKNVFWVYFCQSFKARRVNSVCR